MNANVKSICEIFEDIKEKLIDYQYKFVMDNLMILNNEKMKKQMKKQIKKRMKKLLKNFIEKLYF